MRKNLGILLIFLAQSLGAQVTFGPREPLVEALSRSYLELGLVTPFSTYPQSAKNLKSAWEKAPDAGKPYGKFFQEGIQGIFRGDGVVEGRVTTPRDGYFESFNLYGPQDPAFLSFDVGLMDVNRWGIVLHTDVTQVFNGWFPINLPWPKQGLSPVEFHTFTKGYLWYNFDPLTVEIGRDKLHYGPMDNSFIISDRVPFLDMIRTHLAVGDLAFDWVIASPDTRTGGMNSTLTQQGLYTIHRLEYGQGNWRFAWSELYIVQRYNSSTPGSNPDGGPFIITDILPVFILHQGDISPNNVSEVFDFNWAVLPDWRVMAMGGFDDINGSIVGVPDYEYPTIWAWSLGTEVQGRTPDLSWLAHLELGATHYLFGNFEDNYPYSKAVYNLITGNGTQTMPLSSPYGPGTSWVQFRGYVKFPQWRLDLKAALWNTADGASFQTTYASHPEMDQFGSTWNYSGALNLDYALVSNLHLWVRGAVQGRNAQASWEGALGAKWSWDRRD